MQLLKITTTPIEYTYKIERPHLEMKHGQNARPAYDITPSDLRVSSRNISYRADSSAAYESLNLRSTAAWAEEYRRQGLEAANAAKEAYVNLGNDLARIHKGVTIGQIVRSRAVVRPTTYQTFLPATGPEITWDGPELEIDYTPGSVNTRFDLGENSFDFVPGSFKIEITQRPDIKIEYIGGFNYVPPSSDPDYDSAS